MTEWAKREKCWESFKKTEITIRSNLLRQIMTDRPIRTVTQRLESNQKNSESEASGRIRGIPAEEWFAISAWAKETGNLAAWQRSLAYTLGILASRGKEPSVKQANQGEKILDEVRRLGFRMNQ